MTLWAFVALVCSAPPPTFALEVVRDGATQACPADAIGKRVVALLGRDPFVTPTPTTPRFVVTTRAGARWGAEIRTRLPGRRDGIRRLKVPSATCAALDETVALAVALAIDPLGALEPKPKKPAKTLRLADGAEARSRRAAEPSPFSPWFVADAPPTEAATWRTGWKVGAVASLGLSPEVALSPEAGAMWGDDTWDFGLSVRFHTSVSQLDGQATRVMVASLGASACLGAALGVCVEVEGGAYRADGATGATRPYLAPGLAVRAQLGMAWWAVRIGVPLWRQQLEIEGESAWRMPAVIVGFAMMFAGSASPPSRIGTTGDGTRADAPIER